jgi:enamine deaminase RidA (YjgF/YER057c/UK114 family)
MAIKREQVGPRLSQAVVHGNTVYLAGIVADGMNAEEQTKKILEKIDGLLAAVGSNKSKLLSTTIFITDMRNFDSMNKVWDAWVSPGNTPARATVQAGLANTKYFVEIMCTAALD